LRRIKQPNFKEVQKIVSQHERNFNNADVARIHEAERIATVERRENFDLYHRCFETIYVVKFMVPVFALLGWVWHSVPEEPISPILNQANVYAVDVAQRIDHFDVFFSYICHYASRFRNFIPKAMKYTCFGVAAAGTALLAYSYVYGKYCQYRCSKYDATLNHIRTHFPRPIES